MRKKRLISEKTRLKRKRTEDLRAMYGARKFIVYDRMVHMGLMLPNYKEPLVTRRYLKDCQCGKILRLPVSEFKKFGTYMDMTALQVFCYYNHPRFTATKPWGFDIASLPNREWLIALCVHNFPEAPLSRFLATLHAVYVETNILSTNGRDTSAQVIRAKELVSRLWASVNFFKRMALAALPSVKKIALAARLAKIESKYPFLYRVQNLV